MRFQDNQELLSVLFAVLFALCALWKSRYLTFLPRPPRSSGRWYWGRTLLNSVLAEVLNRGQPCEIPKDS